MRPPPPFPITFPLLFNLFNLFYPPSFYVTRSPFFMPPTSLTDSISITLILNLLSYHTSFHSLLEPTHFPMPPIFFILPGSISLNFLFHTRFYPTHYSILPNLCSTPTCNPAHCSNQPNFQSYSIFNPTRVPVVEPLSTSISLIF